MSVRFQGSRRSSRRHLELRLESGKSMLTRMCFGYFETSVAEIGIGKGLKPPEQHQTKSIVGQLLMR